MLTFFNTLTRKKELFDCKETVKLYTCGPTVYDYAHIGNFRTYVFEDLLKRTLLYFGHTVHHVMNITDVDDKTIKGAIRDKVPLLNYCEPFLKAFHEDIDTLGIIAADQYPAATDYIPQMIVMIEKLIDKKVAYTRDGSVYFAIREFKNYGCLSHLNLDKLQEGAGGRQAADEYDKENASDFVLWKGYDTERDGEIYWESPWGKGRPGWHLECSAMATELLGPSLDIHCGGVDNMFPHHENEIAQSEACTEKPFSRFWMHSEHLLVDNKKMSKSLGNFYTLRSLLEKGFSGTEVRYLLLQTHYKTQLNFTLEGLGGARQAIGRLNCFLERINDYNADNENPEFEALLKTAKNEFNRGLADDLNISASLAALFDLVRDVNRCIDEENLSQKQKNSLCSLLVEFNSVLNVINFDCDTCIPKEIMELFNQREEARASKDWSAADSLRDQITNLGFVLEDTPSGTKVKKA